MSDQVSDAKLLDGQLDEEESREFLHALDLFNRKYFWECHEVLEHIWLTKVPPLKVFLQGIIQAAAAFYHVLNENPKGVVKLAQDATTKLKNFAPEYHGIAVGELVNRIDEFRTAAEGMIKAESGVFDLARIPLIPLPTAGEGAR